MNIEGYIDQVTATEISGWVYDRDNPDAAVDLEIRAGREPLAVVRADTFREDLRAYGKGNGRHGFRYVRPAGARRGGLTARVVGTSEPLQLGAFAIGMPRSAWRFQHSPAYGMPHVDHGFSGAPPAEPGDVRLCERLIAAYQYADARRDGGRNGGKPGLLRRLANRFNDDRDMWDLLGTTYHRDMVQIIARENARGLAEYMRTLYRQGIAHGIVQGPMTTKGLQDPDSGRFEASTVADELVSLAEAVGALSLESPEQHGRWAENLFIDPDDVVQMISKALGIDMVPPPIAGGLFGVRLASGRVLGTRDVMGCYAAFRIRDVLRQAEADRGASVCEIGAGVGGTAYYANRMGVTDYTIIDLPEVNVVQGYCLGRALGGERVRLYGEEDDNAPRPISTPAGGVVRVLPTWCYTSSPARRYDLTFNQDSFPEMHPDYARGYLQDALRTTRYGILSINQEAAAPQTQSRPQSIVRDLMKDVGGYERLYRFRHWLRPGYSEELYRIVRKA
jgi:hypothetical protein